MSVSVSWAKVTVVDSERMSSKEVAGCELRVAAGPMRHTPVITWWERPESRRSMRLASFVSSGLFRIWVSTTTVVSAPRTKSFGWRAAMMRAFSRARRWVKDLAGSLGCGISGMSVGSTVNGTAALRRSSWRRGEADARIRCDIRSRMLTREYRPDFTDRKSLMTEGTE